MKRFVPLKYILGMIVLFFLIPGSLIILISCIIGFNDVTVGICMFLGFLIIVGPVTYFNNVENASIVFENQQIINYMNDGTSNFGWAEEIREIERIEIINNTEAKKHFKNCKSKKVLLITLASCRKKYISVSLFTNKQIHQIIKYIENSK